jgi:hypothetical protein
MAIERAIEQRDQLLRRRAATLTPKPPYPRLVQANLMVNDGELLRVDVCGVETDGGTVPCHEAYAATRDAARNATESP